MQFKVKRQLVILPLAVLASAAVAACGSSANSGASTGKSATTSSSSSGYGSSYGGAGSTGASTSSSGGGSTSASGSDTVSLASTPKGKILVNSKGYTMYLFTADKRDSDHCATTSGCLAIWPALTVSGQPTAGSGVNKSLLGTIKLSNGTRQVTYAGHPLYGYTGDGSPHSTVYIGITSFGGTWYAVRAAGSAVH